MKIQVKLATQNLKCGTKTKLVESQACDQGVADLILTVEAVLCPLLNRFILIAWFCFPGERPDMTGELLFPIFIL